MIDHTYAATVASLAHDSLHAVDFGDDADAFLDPHVEGATVDATRTTLTRLTEAEA